MAEGGETAQPQPPEQKEGGEKFTRVPNCIFCRIIAKEVPATIQFEDDEYICFNDHRPTATHHYLVVPKNHLRDPKSLTAAHIPIVERMVEIGKQVLHEQGGSEEGTRIGFHWPPFILVNHLHLHVVSPESSMGWFSRKVLYRVDSFAFVSHSWMIDRLKNLPSQSQ